MPEALPAPTPELDGAAQYLTARTRLVAGLPRPNQWRGHDLDLSSGQQLRTIDDDGTVRAVLFSGPRTTVVEAELKLNARTTGPQLGRLLAAFVDGATL